MAVAGVRDRTNHSTPTQLPLPLNSHSHSLSPLKLNSTFSNSSLRLILISPTTQSDSLHTERHRIPPTQAQRRQPLARSAILHRVEQRDEHTRPARSDRMSERDRAAVHVHAR